MRLASFYKRRNFIMKIRCFHGAHFIKIFPSQFKFDGKFIVINSIPDYDIAKKSSHMWRQHSCRAMCKIL